MIASYEFYVYYVWDCRSLAKARASALSEAATEDYQKRQAQPPSVTEVSKPGM